MVPRLAGKLPGTTVVRWWQHRDTWGHRAGAGGPVPARHYRQDNDPGWVLAIRQVATSLPSLLWWCRLAAAGLVMPRDCGWKAEKVLLMGGGAEGGREHPAVIETLPHL